MKTVMLLLVLLAAGSTQAQTVWRCGPDGRVYSDKPCTDGSTLAHSDDRRSEAEARAAHEVLKRDQALARELHRQNREAEARAAHEVLKRDQALARELHRQNREAEHDALARGSGLAGISAPPHVPVKPKAPKSKPKKPAPEAPEIWKAVALVTR